VGRRSPGRSRHYVAPVRILIFHGYLLHGTGSNVYNANLAESLVRSGHEVHLLCQDRHAFDLPWVDAAGTWDEGRLRVIVRQEPVRATVYRPDIGGLLPVYVADAYEGIEARPFPELSEAQLRAYLEANVAAVHEVAERVSPELALANHLVMGPLICARALVPLAVPYAVKIHGSALEYTVKPHPRFLRHAREGLASARTILVGSRHTAESLWAALSDDELPPRTRLGPPGVAIEAFEPRPTPVAARGLRSLVDRLGLLAQDHRDAPPPRDPDAEASSFARDAASAVAALDSLDPGRDRLVIFVGKLIGSKGVELLLAAWPLVVQRVPSAKLVIVGFGGFRARLEELVALLAAGDLGGVRRLRSETGAELTWLAEFVAGLTIAEARAYADAAVALPEAVVWTGRLEHQELHDLLPAMEAMVVPSTFPEAFGMVAAEAAACGTLPIVADHSGLAEVAHTLAQTVPEPARALLAFPVDREAVRAIAARVADWLEAPDELRESTREALVATARDRYSWDGVARTVIAAARGDIADLPHP
jgi:glycosyltransferase involved in cell wall biosynthesis